MKKEILIQKLKSPKFWLSLSAAVVMVLQLVGIKVSAPYVNEIISAVCSVFVIIGIMSPDPEVVGKEDSAAPKTEGEQAETDKAASQKDKEA